MSEYTDIVSDGGFDPRNAFDVHAAPTTLEPVAFGHPNTAITGRNMRLITVELEIPSTAQYPQLWEPLVLQSDAAAIIASKDAEIDGFVAEIKSYKDQIETLKAQKFARFNNDDCWIYEGDGNDSLESLICPVVVAPSVLIEQAAIIASKDAELTANMEYMDDQVNQLRAEAERLTRERDKLQEVAFQAQNAALDLIPKLDAAQKNETRFFTVMKNPGTVVRLLNDDTITHKEFIDAIDTVQGKEGNK